MANVNFAEMYLIPRDIYLKMLNSVNSENFDSGLASLFYSNKPSSTSNIVQHQHNLMPPPPPAFPPQNKDPSYPPTTTDQNSDQLNNDNLPPSTPPHNTRLNSTDSSEKYRKGDDLSSTGLTETDVEMQNMEEDNANKEGVSSKGNEGGVKPTSFTNYRGGSSSKSSSSLSSENSSKKSFNKSKKKANSEYPSFNPDFARFKTTTSQKSSSSDLSSVSVSPPKNTRKIGEDYPSFNKLFAKEKTKVTRKNTSRRNSSVKNTSTKNSSTKNSVKSSASSVKTAKKKSKDSDYPSVPPQFSKEKISRPGTSGEKPSATKSPPPEQDKPRVSQMAMFHLLRILNTPETKPFTILDISENSSIKDLKKAFKKISIHIHPDKCRHPDAHLAFTKLMSALDSATGIVNNDSSQKQHYSYAEEPSSSSRFYRPPPSSSNTFTSGASFRESFNSRRRPFYSQNNQSQSYSRPQSTFFGEPFPKQPRYNPPPKTKRGPPTSPLRPPNSARYFREKYGYGIKKWLKL